MYIVFNRDDPYCIFHCVNFMIAVQIYSGITQITEHTVFAHTFQTCFTQIAECTAFAQFQTRFIRISSHSLERNCSYHLLVSSSNTSQSQCDSAVFNNIKSVMHTTLCFIMNLMRKLKWNPSTTPPKTHKMMVN